MEELSAELAARQQQELYLQIAMGVVAALVVLALLFFIMRMINNTRNSSKEAWRAVMRPVGEMASLPLDSDYKLAATKLQDDLSHALARLAEKEGTSDPATPKTDSSGEDVVVQLRASRVQTAAGLEDEQNARIISRLTEENPATVAEIIQIWLNEGKKS